MYSNSCKNESNVGNTDNDSPCTFISCINLHQSASAGLRGLATIGLDVVAGGLGIAASVVRALEVSTARVRVEGFCACRSPRE